MWNELDGTGRLRRRQLSYKEVALVGGIMFRLSIFFFLCLFLPALVGGQSLAELAKKEKERREKNREHGVEVRLINKGEVTVDEPDDPTPPEEEGKDDTEKPDRQKMEVMWRNRVSEARARILAAREQDDFYRELYLGQGGYYVDGQGDVVIKTLAHLQQLAGDAKTELDEAEQALDDLTERARRENIPPGWLR